MFPKKIKTVILGILIILLLGIAVYSAHSIISENVRAKPNPFELDLDSFSQIDTSLIQYSEVKQIKIDFQNPTAIALDDHDNIYVTGSDTVAVFDYSGTQISTFNSGSTANCIAVDSNNLIYLGMENHLQKFDQSGKKIEEFPTLGERAVITAIAVEMENIFIADAGNRIVWHFSIDGELLGRIGGKDVENRIPGFVIPSPYFDVVIGQGNSIWVVNPGQHRLENYSFNGELIYSWGKTSAQVDGFCGCCNPVHFALLPDGSFVTGEKGIIRVKVYDQVGEFKSVVAGPRQFAKKTTGLDLSVDSAGRIYILDPILGAIRIFINKKD